VIGVVHPVGVTTVSIPNPLDWFQSGVQSITQDAAQTVFDGFCRWLASGAQSLIGAVTGMLKPGSWDSLADPSPNLSQGWFSQRMSVMLPVSTLVVLPLLLMATIGAVLHQDARRLARIWGVALPAAVLGGLAAVSLTSEALKATDALCSAITSGLGQDVAGVLTRVGRALVSLGGSAPFLAALVAVVTVVGALFIWLELLLRSAAILLAVFFVPLALAGLVWPTTAHWTKRHLELLVALIASKFVIVASLTLAVGAVGTGSDPGTVMAGGAILLLTGFAPFVLLRMAPMIEAAAISHLEGVSRRPLHAAQRAAAVAEQPLFGLVMGAGGAGAAAAGVAGGAAGGGGAGPRGAGGGGGPHGGGGGGGGAGPGSGGPAMAGAVVGVAENRGGQLDRDLAGRSGRPGTGEAGEPSKPVATPSSSGGGSDPFSGRPPGRSAGRSSDRSTRRVGDDGGSVPELVSTPRARREPKPGGDDGP
jgi:hypothetical protein